MTRRHLVGIVESFLELPFHEDRDHTSSQIFSRFVSEPFGLIKEDSVGTFSIVISKVVSLELWWMIFISSDVYTDRY